MRLINVETRQLESFFFSGDVPPYAILSHTWGADEEEITFQDFQSSNTSKPGIGRFKLEESCKQAKKDGLFYIWNDTCCIDKSNSSELGEAINSMFKWYKKSDRCYAYLQDVPHDQIGLFPKSRWFTRGWTLQELLAPEEVIFFSSEWRILGSCKELAPQVENATGIPQHYLMGIADISEASVAQRMSWAATRQTKRPEDIAYSLLGIFGIVMSMIYGEGEEAFMRLQEEIMRRKIDDSILAWGLEQTEGGEHRPVHSKRGGLASSPANFKNCGLIVSGEFSTTSFESFNTLGPKVRIRLPLYKTPSGHTFGLLGSHPNHDHTRIVGIPLSVVEPASSNTYVRPQKVPARIFNSIECIGSKIATINVLNKNSDHPASQRRHGFFITDLTGHGLEIIRVRPREQWQQGKSTISALLDPETGLVKTQRTWVRMRAKDASISEHLILILDLEGSQDKASAPTPECSLMVGDADRLSAWDDETRHDDTGAFDEIGYRGSHAVSLSSKHTIHATVALESVGAQPMFVVKIGVDVGREMPTKAPSWDNARKIHLIQSQLVLNIKGRDVVLTRHLKESTMLEELKRQVEPLKRQLSSVEDQIKTLEVERERLKSRLIPHEAEISAIADSSANTDKMIRMVQDQEVKLLLEGRLASGQSHNGIDDLWAWCQDDIARRLFNKFPTDIESQHGFSVRDATTLPERLLVRAVLHGSPSIASFAMDTLGAEAKSIFLFRENEPTSLYEIAAARYSPAVVQTLLRREPYMEPEAAVICSLAAKHGNIEVVKSIYYSAKLGTNVLSLCLTQALEGTRHIPTIRLLLENGADANIPNFFPLHLAAESDDGELLTLLLDNGACITTEDKFGMTPLAKASAYSKECTQLLLTRGANPNHGASVEGQVQKPLYIAALCGRVDTARLLLDAGADIEAVAGNGRRALSCAAELGHSKIVALLLDRGADTDAPSATHHKALYLAATQGHLETVMVICEHPSNQTATFSVGRAAALKGARRSGRQDVVEYMYRENISTHAYVADVLASSKLRSESTRRFVDAALQVESQYSAILASDPRAEAGSPSNAPPLRPAPSPDSSNDFPPADPNRVHHLRGEFVDRMAGRDDDEGSSNGRVSPAATGAHVGHDGTDRASGRRPILVDEKGVPRRDAKETEELLTPFKSPSSPPPRSTLSGFGSAVMSRIARR